MSAPPLSPTFGALNRANIELPASPERAWLLLLDRAAWSPSFVAKTLVGGRCGAVGERAVYTLRGSDGRDSSRLEELLWVDAPKRLVQRLALADDSVTTAFADWRLHPRPIGCELEMNVYWLDVPSPGMNNEQVLALRAEYAAHTQGVIEGHLQRIRALLSPA